MHDHYYAIHSSMSCISQAWVQSKGSSHINIEIITEVVKDLNWILETLNEEVPKELDALPEDK